MTTFKVDGEGCVGLNEEMSPSTPEQYHESEEIYPVARAHEFLILMRVVRVDGQDLPVMSFTTQAVGRRFRQSTGVVPLTVEIVSSSDAIITVSSTEIITLLSQKVFSIKDWEDIPVEVSALVGPKDFIYRVSQERIIMAAERREMEKELERTNKMMRLQQTTLADLVDKVGSQARIVGELQQAQSQESAVPRITSSLVTPTVVYPTPPTKSPKQPELPYFSGDLPAPKDETSFEAWIFQVRSLRLTHTDEAVRSAVISRVRGRASTVVQSKGFNAELDDMIVRLVKYFGMGVTDDELLREFHQLSQGARELVQDYGAKLECQFRRLQERFPGRYVAAQLKDRFFHGMHERLRDSMRFLYIQTSTTFEELLEASMVAEQESTTKQITKSKAVTGAVESSTSHAPTCGIVEEQLASLTQYLKSATFNGKGNGSMGKSKNKDPRQQSGGPAVTAAGPFRGDAVPVQCFKCKGWGHRYRQCGNKDWVNDDSQQGKAPGEVKPTDGAPPQVPTSRPPQ